MYLKNKQFIIFFIFNLSYQLGENASEKKPNIILIVADDMVNILIWLKKKQFPSCVKNCAIFWTKKKDCTCY